MDEVNDLLMVAMDHKGKEIFNILTAIKISLFPNDPISNEDAEAAKKCIQQHAIFFDPESLNTISEKLKSYDEKFKDI